MPLGSFRLNRMAQAIQAVIADFGLSHVLHNPNAFTTAGGITTLNDQFGTSVAISESYAIVGAYQEDDAGGTDSGKAYIYSNATGALLHTLHNPSAYFTGLNDWFGYSVGISESYAIVGAHLEDDAGGINSGKAYIFSTATGQRLYTLDNPTAFGTSGSDNFGFSVGICESYAIVAAQNEDDAGGNDSGKAYIYSTATGQLLHTLNNPNAFGTSASDTFGWSVAISESHAIVGTNSEDDATSNNSGKAYIYSTATGQLLHTLDNPNAFGTSAGDRFGRSVAISESHAIVGAPLEDDAGGNDSGKAYIYNNATGALLHTLDNPNAFGTSAADNFGQSVGISESHAIVGAPLEDDAGVFTSGKAYIFSTATGALLHTLDNPNAFGTSAGDSFGRSVAISESYAVVGASERDAGGTGSGKAYMYSGNALDHMSAPTPAQELFVTAATNVLTATVTIPSNTQAGDIALLFDTSTITTDIIPAGWTSIVKSTTTGIRTNVSYRILTAGDPGTTVTGMGDVTRKVMYVIRLTGKTNPVVALSTPTQQATTAAPTGQTIPAGASNARSMYVGVYAHSGSTIVPNRAFTQGGGFDTPTEYVSVSSYGIYVRFSIRQTGLNQHAQQSVSLSMTDAGTNTLQGFRMDIS